MDPENLKRPRRTNNFKTCYQADLLQSMNNYTHTHTHIHKKENVIFCGHNLSETVLPLYHEGPLYYVAIPINPFCKRSPPLPISRRLFENNYSTRGEQTFPDDKLISFSNLDDFAGGQQNRLIPIPVVRLDWMAIDVDVTR